MGFPVKGLRNAFTIVAVVCHHIAQPCGIAVQLVDSLLRVGVRPRSVVERAYSTHSENVRTAWSSYSRVNDIYIYVYIGKQQDALP